MPRPEDRDRVEPVRTLRPVRVLPVTALPVVAALRGLGTEGAAAGAIPQVEQ
jgi:hypothetical protein